MNKKGIQLAVNFLVILIVSIVLFTLGITMFYTIFNKAGDFEKVISDQTRTRIENVLAQGKMIALLDIQKEIERGQTDSFAIGISNELGSAQNFFLYVKNDTFVSEDNEEYDFPIANWDLKYYTDFGTIERNQYKANLILISVPKDVLEGTYIFNVYVCNRTECPTLTEPTTDDLYTGSFKKIYVVVP